MNLRHALAGAVSVLLLSPALATAASAAPAAPASSSTSAVVVKGGSSPTAAVNGFARTLSSGNGKAACGFLTKSFANKTVKAAVKAGLSGPGSCAKVLTKVGTLIKQGGGIPKFTLSIKKRTANTAVVALSYKKNKVAGTYSTTKVGGSWLISGSTIANNP